MSSLPPGTDPLPIAPGETVSGKYRVERVLGKGGMGVVVEARHLALEERVALKFLLPAFATNTEAAARFMREARAVFKIKSEHVVRVMDVATLEGGSPYMVLELLEGSDLLRVLKTQRTLPVDDAVDYVIQACDAIGEAHSHGIIHRDVKPSNLFLVTGRDGMPVIKVLDFGISKVVGAPGIDALTRTTTTMGSAHYMSPEQMRSIRDVDHRTDIYALGITLFTLLTGKHPYGGNSIPQVYSEILTGMPKLLRTLRPDLPEHFAGVIAKAYLRDPAARYQSIAELVFALGPYAPARSRPTIERIARLVGRPGASMRSEPPAQKEGPAEARRPGQGAPSPAGAPANRATVSDLAPTRVMEGRSPRAAIRSAAPAPLTEPEPIPTSNGPAIVVLAFVALALLAGAGALLLRWTRGPTAVEPQAGSMSAAPTVAAAEPPSLPVSATGTAAASTTASAAPTASAAATVEATSAGSAAPTSRPSARTSSSPKAGPAASSAPPATSSPPAASSPPKSVFDDR